MKLKVEVNMKCDTAYTLLKAFLNIKNNGFTFSVYTLPSIFRAQYNI